jgi:hypothetical protein
MTVALEERIEAIYRKVIARTPARTSSTRR